MEKSDKYTTNGQVLAMDIGSYNTKLVVGSFNKGRVHINNVISTSTPFGAYEDGTIKNIDKLTASIEEMLLRENIRTKQAICTLESTSIITREITLPSVKASEMKGMLEFEIQQYLPFALDQYIIQYKILEESQDDEGKKNNMLVAALPKGIADGYLTLLDRLNLKPIALDIHSNTADKLFSGSCQINYGDSLENNTIALIDLGHRQSNVSILSKGHYKFNRLVSVGGRNIDQNIAGFLGISVEDAVIRKMAIKDITEMQKDDFSSKTKILGIMRSSIDLWLEEYERIFKYYMTRTTGNQIDHIYLYGGSSNIGGIEKYLEETFNIPTTKMEQISRINSEDIKFDADFASYINAIGAIIRR